MRRTFGKKSLEKDVKIARVISGLASPTVRACRLYDDADFTHNSTGNYLAVPFAHERSDAYSMHSTVSNNSRINFYVAGWYLVGGQVEIENNSTGIRKLAIREGGSTFISAEADNAPSASAYCYLSTTTLYYFSASNYIELLVYQSSGGNLTVRTGADYSPEFWAIKLG